MTVTEHNEQLVVEKRALFERLGMMQLMLARVCSVYADDKGKIRIPKTDLDAASDVVNVTWKTLKPGSLVVSVERSNGDSPD